MKLHTVALLSATLLLGCSDKNPKTEQQPLRLQLNWFHDPTFAGEYIAAKRIDATINISEGGTNVNPLQRLKAGVSDVSIVGIDIALQAIASDLATTGKTPLRIIFADFQRNPVGWIVHPDVGRRLNFDSAARSTEKTRNDWLFARFQDGSIRPGDKRGTETTAIWTRWSQIRGLKKVPIMQVGFDPTVVLSAPALAYPVYLNEEPFKLAERLGESLLVFDPANDGVILYGNVLVATEQIISKRAPEIKDFLNILSSSWRWALDYPDSAAEVVKSYYRGASDSTVKLQIQKTVEFVFFNTSNPGTIDTAQNGRLDQTIASLVEAGSLPPGFSIEKARPYVVFMGIER